MIGIVSMAKDVEKYIGQAIWSIESLIGVKARIYVAYERGASMDRTEEILREWERNSDRVVLVEGVERKSVAEAANDAATVAIEDRCKYLARLDLDNYFIPFGLRILRENIGSRDLVWGDHIKIDEDGKVIGWSQTPEKVTAGELVRGLNRIVGNGILMRRKCWEECPWDEEFEGGWDLVQYVELMVKGFRLEKVVNELCVPVVVERVREGMFEESVRSGRWMRWRKRLLRKLPELRSSAMEVIGNEDSCGWC